MKRLYWLAVGFAIGLTLFFVAACVGTVNADWKVERVPREVPENVQVQEGFFQGLAAALAGGAVSLGSSIANWFSGKETQEKTWEREDTAVQRRVKDLEAAGLSPTLAAGSAATTSATSAPQMEGNGVADALSAAAQLQGIKNAKQENANMQTARLVDMAQIGFLSRQGQKMDAEKNYFNAMANKALIDGQLAQFLGLKQAAEIDERTKGYKYSAMNNYYHTMLMKEQGFREALENDLIHSTGVNSSNSSILGMMGKVFTRGIYDLAELFGNKDSYRFRFMDSLQKFEY